MDFARVPPGPVWLIEGGEYVGELYTFAALHRLQEKQGEPDIKPTNFANKL